MRTRNAIRRCRYAARQLTQTCGSTDSVTLKTMPCFIQRPPHWLSRCWPSTLLALLLAGAANPPHLRADTNATPRFIGFSTTTRTDYTNAPAASGYQKYDIYQLWENKILVHLLMAESTKFKDAGCLRMEICRDVDRKLWVQALELMLVKDAPKSTTKDNLWKKNTRWETRMEWWTADETVLRRIDSLEDLPVELPGLETLIKNTLLDKGQDVTKEYPKKAFLGFRWANANKSIPDAQLTPLSAKTTAWLQNKRAKTPPQLFQVIRRSEAPDLPDTRSWHRFPVRLNKDEIILVEFFTLPN